VLRTFGSRRGLSVEPPEELRYDGGVKVRIRHQRREVELSGVRTVRELLDRLQLNPETVLVVRGSELLTRDARLNEEDDLEVRPVVSGGQGCAGVPGTPGTVSDAVRKV
jgi:sulfur carrier protein